MRIWLAFFAILISTGSVEAADDIAAYQKATEQIQAALEKGKPDDALRKADIALAKAPNKQSAQAVQLFRMLALTALGKPNDALAAADLAMEADDPDMIANIILEYGVDTGHADIARHATDRLINAFPNVARRIPRGIYWRLIRTVRDKSGDQIADDYALRFAAIGLGEGNPAFRDNVALSAVDINLRRGDLAKANALAATIDDVSTLADMLSLKVYAPLWPALEARVGSHISIPANANFVSAEGNLRRDPDSFEAKRNFLHAAVEAGKFDEGDRMAAAFAATPTAMGQIDEEGGWLVNEHAILLRALKRPDDADLRYAAMRVIKIEDKPWLISMIINRAEFLVRDQAYARAAPLVAEAEKLSQTYGSPYAQQLVRRLKLCAAAGTKIDTGPALSDLMAHKEDTRG